MKTPHVTLPEMRRPRKTAMNDRQGRPARLPDKRNRLPLRGHGRDPYPQSPDTDPLPDMHEASRMYCAAFLR